MYKTLCMVGCALLCSSAALFAQNTYSMQECIEYAMAYNHQLKKAQYDRDKASYSRRKAMGALLPQINGSAALNDNLQKPKFVMPNFVNKMLPPPAQDPNASEYMTIEMGTKMNANIGVAFNQQLLNFPLFNTMALVKTAEKMAALGVASNEEDVIGQTAALYYAVQATEYGMQQMERSIGIIEQMLETMEVNYRNRLVRKTDVDRLRVNLTNLETQKSAMVHVIETQKNLLKLQMGFEMEKPIAIQPIDLTYFEQKANDTIDEPFRLEKQTGYRIVQEQLNMAKLQQRSAIYENLPVLSLMANYQYNGISDRFFRGKMNYWYPTSMIGLSLKIPILGGGARRAKIRESRIDILKAQEDAEILKQSLNMAQMNARNKLNDAVKTIAAQRKNRELAEEVLNVAEKNYALGVASMSDFLNATQALVQAQMNYANALNDYMSAYIALKKAMGTLRDMMESDVATSK